MQSVANPELISPAILHKTAVPFLTPHDSKPTNGQTIDVSVCSEFKTYSVPATPVDARHKLRNVLDGQHQPMIFTVGNDSLNFFFNPASLLHSLRLRRLLESYDITPSSADASVSAFDLYQHNSGKVAIAVAIAKPSSSGLTTLYYAKPFDVTGAHFSLSDISFSEIKNGQESLVISTIQIAATDPNLSGCFILVGTAEHGSTRATDYIVTPGSKNLWVTLSLPEDATEVLKVIPATQRKPIYGCAVSLYKQPLSGAPPELDAPDVGSAISCLSLDGTYNIALLLDNLGGGARDVSATITSKGLSDLYVAGIKGIGYYASQLMDRDPTVILSDIAFTQVIACESNFQVSVLAISTDGNLYFIDGKRASSGVVPTFTATGFPIRRNVGILSTQYNAAINACEAIYVNSDSEELRHIWRDPGTFMWSEQSIHVEAIAKMVSFTAFVSQVNLRGNAGAAVGDGYEASISTSEIAYALVNDKTHRLDSTPRIFTTDSSGSIRVVIQTSQTISAPTINVTIKGLGQEETVNVEPRQRVIRKMCNAGSGTDLKNAKSTDGNPVFPNTTVGDATFDAVAQTLNQVPTLLPLVHGDPASLIGEGIIRPSSKSISLSFEKRGSTFYAVPFDSSSIIPLEASVFSDLGDFLEGIANGLLEVVKFVINVSGDVVNFIVTIAGKVLRFVLNTVGTLIRSIATVLKDVLGIDLFRFLALFGFLFDYENIKKTQEIIKRSANEGAELLQDVVQRNADWMKGCVKSCRSLVSPYIKDERVPAADDAVHWTDASSYFNESVVGKLLRAVLDNPIIHEVMKFASFWILKAVSVLDEQISFPGADAMERLFQTIIRTLSQLFKDEADNLETFVRDLFHKFGEFLAGKRSLGELLTALFSDGLWTLFDAVEDAICAFLDILPDVIGACISMVTGAIKLPGITAFWEAFTETTFSILDVGSMILAQIMYLVTMMWQEKLPFEVMSPWYSMLPKKGSIILPITKSSLGLDTDRAQLLSLAQSQPSDADANSGADIHTFLDLAFGLASSFFVLGSTACYTTVLVPKLRQEEYELQPLAADLLDSSVSGFSEPTATKSITPFFKNAQLAFTGSSLLMEVASFVNNVLVTASNAREHVIRYIKLVAIVMKISDLATNLGGIGNAITAALSPVANIMNSLPGGIWSFVDSEQRTEDILALITSTVNGVAGAFDILTIIFEATEQPELKWASVGASALLNVGQMGTTVAYGAMLD